MILVSNFQKTISIIWWMN